MPIYDYRCPVCGNEIEKYQGADSPPPECQSCKVGMERVYSPIAFIKFDGMFPARRVWMDRWTPDSEKFSTGSQHGERY